MYLFCIWAMANCAIAQNWQKNNSTQTLTKWDSLKGEIQLGYTGRVLYADTFDNYLYMAGVFYGVDNVHTKGIARWNGVKWDSLGAGIDGVDTANILPQNVFTITRYNNELYVGGAFTSLGNKRAISIGKWNGANWDTLSKQPFKTSSQGVAGDLEVINNELYIGGFIDTVAGMPVTGIAKWNGINWSSLNFPNLSGFTTINAITEYNGEIYAAGNFNSSAYPNDTIGEIARYNGTVWRSVGGGINGSMAEVASMVVYNNELYVAGYFFTTDGNVGNYIQKWNGTAWGDVGGGTGGGNGQITKLLVHNGKLYAVGVLQMAGGIPADRIAVWDGNKWCGLGSTFDNTISSETIYKDTLYICGGFKTIDGDSINSVAKWVGGNYTDTCGALSGIQLIGHQTNFSLYPNPSNGSFVIETNATTKQALQVYDVNGKMVLSQTIIGKTTIDANSLNEGVYNINIISNNGVINKRLVIVK